MDCRCHGGRAHTLFAAFLNLQRRSIFSMVSYGMVVEDGGYCVSGPDCLSCIIYGPCVCKKEECVCNLLSFFGGPSLHCVVSVLKS